MATGLQFRYAMSLQSIYEFFGSDEEVEAHANTWPAIAQSQGLEVIPSLFDFDGFDFWGPDWTARVGHNWPAWAAEVTATSTSMLEIGTHEGRGTVAWARDVLPGWSIDTVDIGLDAAFPGTKGRLAWLWKNFGHETELRPRFLFGCSAFVLPDLAVANHEAGRAYGLVYIDGSHNADDVLLDAEYSWRMLECGGVMVFDDYNHQTNDKLDDPQATSSSSPRRGIHCFLMLHGGEFEVLNPVAPTVQLAIKKTVPSRALFGTDQRPLGGDDASNPLLGNGERHPPFPLPLIEFSAGRRPRVDGVSWIASGAAVDAVGTIAKAPVELAINATYTAATVTAAGAIATHDWAQAADAHIGDDEGRGIAARAGQFALHGAMFGAAVVRTAAIGIVRFFI